MSPVPSNPTQYPRVRLADLRLFAGVEGKFFNFDDLQAATGLNLAEGRKAINMLRALGLVERLDRLVPAKPSKPVYRLTAAAFALLDDPPQPRYFPAVESMKLESLRETHNARGLPVKVESIVVETTVVGEGVRRQDAELNLVVQTKRAVADEIQAVANQVQGLVGGRVNVVLAWRVGAI